MLDFCATMRVMLILVGVDGGRGSQLVYELPGFSTAVQCRAVAAPFSDAAVLFSLPSWEDIPGSDAVLGFLVIFSSCINRGSFSLDRGVAYRVPI